MKLKTIVNALPSLQKLAATELPCKVLYKINKIMNGLEYELKFYNDKRDELFKKYDVKVEQYGMKVEEKNQVAFAMEFEELLNIDTENDIKPIDIPADDNMKLSYNDIKALEGIINIQFDE